MMTSWSVRQCLIGTVVALFLIATLLVSPTATAATGGTNPPKGVHLSYNGIGTATLTWYTASASTSRAEWGTSVGPPYPSSATGTDYSSPGNAHLHTVTLGGLAANTPYYYRVGDASMTNWFGQSSFRSAPAVGAADPFTFVAAGDWSYTDGTTATSNAIASFAPNLALLLGDHYYSDSEANVKTVFDKWQVFAAGTFAQAAMGNHEYKVNGDKYTTPTPVHCAYVNLPGNERTYAFTYGNTFFITADWGQSVGTQTDGVDTSPPNCSGTAGTPAIRTWLDAQLAAADADPAIKWKVVFQHFQCYLTDYDKNSSLCPDGSGNVDQMEDILVNRGVDLVLTAHAHTYGRTYPVKFNVRQQNGTLYDRPGAPLYLVIGTGGSPRTNTCRTPAYIAICLAPTPTLGYGRFTVEPTRIRYEFVENALGVVDSFTLYNSPPSGPDVTVSPDARTVVAGESTTATVTTEGDPATVNLSLSGCPPDANCTVSPASGNPPFQATLTVATAGSTPLGAYTILIRGDNGTGNDTATFTLTVASIVTRTYQKGDGGAHSETDDTYLYSGSPNQNFGTETLLYVDASGCIASGTVCKTLIKFPDFLGPDPGQVPLGSTIQSATIEVDVTDPGGLQTYYQITEPWTELGATWNGFVVPGTPGNKGPAGTFTPLLGPIPIDVTTLVQDWADGETNQGILIDSTSGDGVDFQSSESPTRPKLTVTYSPPSGPQPFDFSVSVNPASGTTAPGGSVAATVTATLVSGQPEPVSFRCEDLPAGAACAFEPAACSPTCTSALTLSTASGTPPGTYPVRVIGSNGTADRQAIYTLTVTNTVTVSFMKGDGGAYSETDDTYMTSGAPNANYGTETQFKVDAGGCVSGICKGLLRYPAIIGPNGGQVPAGAQIISAILQITISDPGGTQEARRMAATWGETTVTWNTWSPPGSPPTAGSPISFASPKARIAVNVTTFVQSWADGSGNHGMLITTASSNGVKYESSESAYPPKLTVTYRGSSGSAPPPSPEQPNDAGPAVTALPLAAAPQVAAWINWMTRAHVRPLRAWPR